ncbi:MAG: NAD(P)-binding domain-containing protein [Flaviflexus sp.]
MTREAVGIIVPGDMGSPMAKQLIKAGRSIIYYSRSPKAELE